MREPSKNSGGRPGNTDVRNVYLHYKAEAYGKQCIEVNEAYTSKTASWTGEIVKIGNNRNIRSQGVTVDRDINGARGIMLRALRASSIVAV